MDLNATPVEVVIFRFENGHATNEVRWTRVLQASYHAVLAQCGAGLCDVSAANKSDPIPAGVRRSRR
jgi:hypothetical protein